MSNFVLTNFYDKGHINKKIVMKSMLSMILLTITSHFGSHSLLNYQNINNFGFYPWVKTKKSLTKTKQKCNNYYH